MFSRGKPKPLIKLMTSVFYAVVVSIFILEELMLLSLGIILLVGLSAAAIFERIGLPRIIGMLGVGIAVSPYVLDLLDPSVLGISSELRRIALIIILVRQAYLLICPILKRSADLRCLCHSCPCAVRYSVMCCSPRFCSVSSIIRDKM